LLQLFFDVGVNALPDCIPIMVVNIVVFNQLKDLAIHSIIEISDAFVELALGIEILLFPDVYLKRHVASQQSVLFLYELFKLGYCSNISENISVLREGELH